MMNLRYHWLTLALPGVLVAAGLLAACGDDGDEPSEEQPAFPADYADSYTEVRDCRPSADHDLMNIRILADQAALDAYESRDEPFPEGAVVLKEEYDFGDDNCSGEIQQWTVMQKLPKGDNDNLGWLWQRVDDERNITRTNDARCVGCHTGCGVAPDGYEGTCAIP